MGAWKERGSKPWDGRGRLAANFVHSVITNPAATRAYLSYWDFGTVILDIRDPAHPRYLGRTIDAQGDVHSAALARNGKVLVETHETADGFPTLYDISNPARPKLLSAFRLPGTVSASGFSNGVHDPKVLGNRAYFSWYVRGVAVADISNPRKPRLLARFRPPTAADPDDVLCDTAACRLVWGVYATKRYVLASDMLSGLWVAETQVEAAESVEVGALDLARLVHLEHVAFLHVVEVLEQDPALEALRRPRARRP